MLYRKTRFLGFLFAVSCAGFAVTAAETEQRVQFPQDAAGTPLTVRPAVLTGEALSVINREDAGRQEVDSRATEYVREANAFLAEGEYIKARDKYLAAVKLFRSYNTAVFQTKVEHCQRQIGLCYYYMAEEAMEQADRQAQVQDFEEAIKLCKEAQKFYPEGADELQRKIEIYERRQAAAVARQDASAEKLMPNQKSQEYQIQVLLQQGRELAVVQEYSKALRKFQEVLLIDPYNADALQNMKAMNLRIGKIGRMRQNISHRKMIAEVEWKFAIPIILEGGEENVENFIEKEPQKKSVAEEAPLVKKLNSIIIPTIDFEEVSVPAALKSLSKQSRELDPEEIGVNIFLRRAARPAATEQQSSPDMAGGDMGMGMPDESLDEEGDSTQKEQTVNLLLKDISLMNAIIKLCESAKPKLKYRVEKHAVVIAPHSVALDDMETQIFPVEQQALASALDGDISDETALISFFKNSNEGVEPVDFPTGSKIIYDPLISRLIVTNTPENLRKIDQIITDILETQEPMVQITAKFIEISQTDLDELAFNYQYAAGMDADRRTSHFVTDQSSSQLLRHYVPDDKDAREKSSMTNDAAFFFQRSDKNSSFTAAMYALDWADSTDVLASPRVTTASNQPAHIEMVKERYFPEEWEDVDLPENNAGGSGDGNATTSTWRGTRADPQPTYESDPTQLGVIFDITPTIDIEQRTITADVVLPIQTFQDWFVYDGRTRKESDGSTEGSYYQMPIFLRRELSTKITLYDGETIVLGGVAYDKNTVVNDKVPILGDLPLIGRFFQSKYTNSEKRNLLVFLTCKLVKPDGSAFFPAEIRSRGIPDFGRNR